MNPINVLATLIYFVVFILLMIALCVYLWDVFRRYAQEKKADKQKEEGHSHP
jgi:hypothetical protein